MKLTRKSAEYLASELLLSMPEKIVDRGVEYWLRRRVSDLKVETGMVIAHVRGENIYRVEIDLDFPHLHSACTCPYGGLCKHIAAVVSHVLSVYEDPTMWLRARTSRHRKFATEIHQKQVTTRDPKIQHRPSEDASPDKWMSYFDDHVKSIQPTATSLQPDILLKQLQRDCESDTQRWAEEMRFEYLLLMRLALFEHGKRLLRDIPYSHGLRMYVNDLANQMVEFVQAAAETTLKAVRRETAEVLATKVRHMLLSANDPDEAIGTLYHLFWWRVLYHQLDARRESETLGMGLNGQPNQPLKRGVAGARGFLMALCDEDRSAMKMMGNVHDEFYAVIMVLLMLGQQESWDRLEKWLRWLTPLTASFSDEFQQILGHYWSICATRRPELEHDGESFLRENLPATEEVYAAYLLGHARYRSWAELQVLLRRTPFLIPKDELEMVGKADASALLPLYHQAIEGYVHTKTRNGYMTAVQLMSDLHDVYRKLKRLSEWERWLRSLVARHSRLRALHEEIRLRGWPV